MNTHIDAWIHEEKIMLGFPNGKQAFHGLTAARRAREALEAADCPVYPSFVEISKLREVIYVEPSAYDGGEDWSGDEWSHEKREGWVEVWMVDIGALAIERYGS